ncbi:MAG: DUF979 domain-containing protein [Proteobacteria bacterium]|nr:DUF979 domain-containing protein [Pseudomonadota bacterium]
MITLHAVYLFAGLLFAAYAGLNLADRGHPHRLGNGAFWALMAASMLAGDRLGDLGNGLVVAALALVAMLRLTGPGAEPSADAATRAARAARLGHRLFALALVIPLVALGATFLFQRYPALVEPKQGSLVALAASALVALGLALVVLRASPRVALAEGRRLIDAVGWAAVLPQALVALGAVFTLAGVGDAVGQIFAMAIPAGSLAGAVLAYGLGMALFTMALGNAFAAFPVMFAGVGLPLLIRAHHGDPAVVAAIGMLAGFCGTLLTPMAANFNLVPAALLNLADRNAVIRRQAGTALPLLAANILFIWLFAFRS